MRECLSCAAEVQPEWKFCISCGVPIAADAASIAPAVAPGTNPLAVLAFVLALIGGAPALIFGHIALRQIAVTRERGTVLAIIATVLGYVWLLGWSILLFRLLTNAN